MPKNKFFFSALALGIFFLCVAATPVIAECEAHHDHYSLDNGNPGNCGATINDWDVHGSQNDGCSAPYIHYNETCKPWQSPSNWTSASETNDCFIRRGYICSCDKECLLPQSDQKYYDQPTANGTPQSENNITLPVLLTWTDPNNHHDPRKSLTTGNNGHDVCGSSGPYSEDENIMSDCSGGQQKIPSGGTKSYLVDFLVNFVADEKDPAKKAIRFDPAEPPDPNKQPQKGQLLDTDYGPDNKAAKILEFVINVDVNNPEKSQQFNSRDTGWPCLFNSDSIIYWRVRPCCDKDGNGCMAEDSPNSQWWKFKTATAPEPLGITDKNRANPEPDPDWNGPKYVDNVDFCTAGLKWCSAKVDPASKQQTFQQNIGHNQALAYQMAVNYNEQITLGGILNAIQSGVNIWGALNMASLFLNQPFVNPGKQSQCHYLLVDKTENVCKAEIVEPHGTLQKTPATEFSNATDQNFNRGFFTKNLQYDWTLRRCFDNSNAAPETCQQNVIKKDASLKAQGYGQTWSLKTVSDYILAAPLLSSPPDDQKSGDQNASTPVGIPPIIAWKPQCGANSFEYELSMVDSKTGAITPLLTTQKTTAAQITFVKNAPAANATINNEDVKTDIRVDTAYKWRARSCWPSIAIKNVSQLCDDKSWTNWFSFRTTGRPPQNLKAVGDNPANIPTTFSWSPVPGALSYVLDLSPASGTHISKLVATQDQSKPITIRVAYPELKPNLTYSYKVKTCADAAGSTDLCGAWSAPAYSLKTTSLPAPGGQVAPPNLSSLDNYPNRLAWNAVKGAVAYQVTMNYLSKDNSPDCPKSGQLFQSATTNSSFDPPSLPLACLGDYTWSVASCFSSDCKPEETGLAATWKFSIDKGGGKSSGLMVCGLRDDDLSTPWNDRKTCEFGDIFKFLEKLIDFVLFKLSVWLLPILAAITGGLFYTQAGGADVLGKVKTMWKYIGIGYALLFFAWILTTWTLQAFGYHGLWWKIL